MKKLKSFLATGILLSTALMVSAIPASATKVKIEPHPSEPGLVRVTVDPELGEDVFDVVAGTQQGGDLEVLQSLSGAVPLKLEPLDGRWYVKIRRHVHIQGKKKRKGESMLYPWREIASGAPIEGATVELSLEENKMSTDIVPCYPQELGIGLSDPQNRKNSMSFTVNVGANVHQRSGIPLRYQATTASATINTRPLDSGTWRYGSITLSRYTD